MKILKGFAVLFAFCVIASSNIGTFAVSNTPDSNLTYNQAMTMNKPVVVEFYADWCGACKRVAPILNEIKPEYASKFNFVNLNIDNPENSVLSNKFNVKSLPSIFIVNPKTGEAKFLNQNNYFSTDTLRKELDSY